MARRTERRQVLAWSLWDWGSAAFNAVIVTFVFSVYLTDAVGEDLPGRVSASSWLGWALGLGGLMIALLAPITGQRSDATGRRRRSLGLLTLAVVDVTALMFLVKDDYHYLWLGLVLISLGSVLFELAQVPYFAMIRQVSTPDTIGRVSGVGWAFGYLGGIVLLLLCYFGFVVRRRRHPRLPRRAHRGRPQHPSHHAAGRPVVPRVRAAGAVHPCPSCRRRPAHTPSAGFFESYRILYADVRALWRSDRSTVVYLVASALYRDGLAGIFTFGAVLAVSVYGIARGRRADLRGRGQRRRRCRVRCWPDGWTTRSARGSSSCSRWWPCW